ncbi:putative g2 mitotic-specific cyclin-b protein [Phialemonium atrogriseum]|uniref:G2 mitotic-specific cyclin-b protein n=1 Tax=Phialemonium atrogriseum TaxID=1093897 RepID=A0AAJ0C847_9PEZI|nr:putative g2 mitotic-specific cyclin-b protein [Phialemonium atrogriseum]KAK1769446.1 putative g2 mitotic-specific cyclin-b protein [Phialemonium atrogriseum]
MPGGRPTTRQRLVSNENDENSGSTRVTRATRAKAAALNVDELSLPSKAALQSKKSTVNANAQAGQRRRAALGDVSNVTKVDVDAKKVVAGKTGLVSKAAQPSGIQKKTTTTSTTRTALGSKEINKKVEPKRSGSGSGAIGAVQKRKVLASTSNTKEGVTPEEGEPRRKKVHTAEPEKRSSKSEEIASNVFVPEAPSAVEFPPGVRDLDSEDLEDPLMVAEYANEIFEYLRDLECNSVPNPEYMSHQDDLEWKTRGILIDWLIEVHTRFHLLPETLFLAVNVIDRFLSEKVVQLDRLQLVGITAMFIASKYEEVLSPHVANFRHVADDGFTESEILSAERFILNTLSYDLSYPNPMNFLRRISKADNYDIQTRTVGKYLTEISLLDHRFMAYRSSHVAAAAMYLARLILDRGDWDETLSYYAGYTEEDIEPVFQLMVDYLARPVVHEAFFKKYASKKFLKASILTRHWAKKNAHIYGIADTHLSLDQIS